MGIFHQLAHSLPYITAKRRKAKRREGKGKEEKSGHVEGGGSDMTAVKVTRNCFTVSCSSHPGKGLHSA